MATGIVRALILAAFAAASTQSTPLGAQPAPPDLGGIWVLNDALTQKPAEVGFTPDWAQAPRAGGAEGSRGGGHGRRGGSGSGGGAGGVFPVSRESADDSTRIEQLTAEVRTPPAHLTIVQKPTSVSIADDQGRSRTFHPDGKLEELTIGTVPLPTTTRWNGENLTVLYDVEQGRQLRYTYAIASNPKRLLVDITLIEHGKNGDEVRLTYKPPGEGERTVLAAPPSAPSASAAPSGTAFSERPPVLPPGSELRGLTTIGTVVDDLTSQAAACGLDKSKIKTSIAKILADAGFRTEPYGNEETYVYVSVVTSKLSDGLCVSRYDATLESQADATLPYLKGLVSLQVQLLHDGGMTGGSASQHASGVMDALTKSVNGFIEQIRAANK
jgi:hypothetical protein